MHGRRRGAGARRLEPLTHEAALRRAYAPDDNTPAAVRIGSAATSPTNSLSPASLAAMSVASVVASFESMSGSPLLSPAGGQHRVPSAPASLSPSPQRTTGGRAGGMPAVGDGSTRKGTIHRRHKLTFDDVDWDRPTHPSLAPDEMETKKLALPYQSELSYIALQIQQRLEAAAAAAEAGNNQPRRSPPRQAWSNTPGTATTADGSTDPPAATSLRLQEKPAVDVVVVGGGGGGGGGVPASSLSSSSSSSSSFERALVPVAASAGPEVGDPGGADDTSAATSPATAKRPSSADDAAVSGGKAGRKSEHEEHRRRHHKNQHKDQQQQQQQQPLVIAKKGKRSHSGVSSSGGSGSEGEQQQLVSHHKARRGSSSGGESDGDDGAPASSKQKSIVVVVAAPPPPPPEESAEERAEREFRQAERAFSLDKCFVEFAKFYALIPAPLLGRPRPQLRRLTWVLPLVEALYDKRWAVEEKALAPDTRAPAFGMPLFTYSTLSEDVGLKGMVHQVRIAYRV